MCFTFHRHEDKSFVLFLNLMKTTVDKKFRMRQPPLIKTQEQIKVEISLLEALSDIEVAIRTLNVGEDDLTINTLDRHYANMKCALDVVESSDSRFEVSAFALLEKLENRFLLL